jgi:hypothetical protein
MNWISREEARVRRCKLGVMITNLQHELERLKAEESQLVASLKARNHTKHKERQRRSADKYAADLLRASNYVINNISLHNSRKSQHQRSERYRKRDEIVTIDRWWNSAPLASEEDKSTSIRKTVENYRSCVRTFCRVVLKDSRQQHFHALVRNRRKQINTMSFEDARKEKASLLNQPVDVFPSDDASQFYVLHGPNTIFLGEDFRILWQDAMSMILLLYLPQQLIDVVLEHFYGQICS